MWYSGVGTVSCMMLVEEQWDVAQWGGGGYCQRSRLLHNGKRIVRRVGCGMIWRVLVNGVGWVEE